MRRARLFVAFTAIAAYAMLLPARLRAQESGFAAIITSDSTGTRVPAAVVTVVELDRSAESNWLGEVHMTRIPAGTYTLRAKKLGFAPFETKVSLVAGQMLSLEMMLAKAGAAQMLAEEKVVAPAHLNAKQSEFERRRAAGFGAFITSAELDSSQGKSLAALLLKHSPGVRIVNSGTQRFVAQGRGVASLTGLPPADPYDPKSPHACYSQIFLDGIRIYQPVARAPQVAPNMDSFDFSQLAGVEFYTGPATTPPELNGPGAFCGTLVLWTK